MEKIKDGWHEISGFSCFVEDGVIIRGMKNNDTETAYPYRWSDKEKAWCIEKPTVSAFRAAVKRGTMTMK